MNRDEENLVLRNAWNLYVALLCKNEECGTWPLDDENLRAASSYAIRAAKAFNEETK